MAGINDFLKADMTRNVAIGAGLFILAPVVIPALAAASRPLVKAVIKSGIILYEKGRETVAEVGEVLDDLLEEAKSEVHQQQVASHYAGDEAAPEAERPHKHTPKHGAEQVHS